NTNVQSGGTELLRVIESGNVGLGISTPGAVLHIAPGSGVPGFQQSSNGTFNIDAPAIIGGRFRVLENGNVGIGTQTPAQPLHVFRDDAGSGTQVRVQSATNQGQGVEFYEGATFRGSLLTGQTVLQIRNDNNDTANSIIIRQDSGNVGIGTTTTPDKLTVLGDAGKTVGGTAWNDLSDIRFKKNITPLSNESILETVRQLRPVSYEWNDERAAKFGPDPGKNFGFIAQELKEVIPEFVFERDGYFWYNPSGIESILTAAIQQLDSKVSSLSFQLEQIASSSSTILSQDDPSILNIDSIFSSILSKFTQSLEIVFEKGLVRIAQVIADTVVAEKVTTDNLEIKDSATGDVYCVRIVNGEWDKTIGSCGSAV
ncbi:MAG: tail fiber domain-containing protein, partial [Candidatus Paceibacterota bacterium]